MPKQQRPKGRRGNRIRCSRGKDCEFRDEYQHGLEFYHDDDDDSGDGGGTGSSFDPFSGTGRVASAAASAHSSSGISAPQPSSGTGTRGRRRQAAEAAAAAAAGRRVVAKSSSHTRRSDDERAEASSSSANRSSSARGRAKTADASFIVLDSDDDDDDYDGGGAGTVEIVDCDDAAKNRKKRGRHPVVPYSSATIAARGRNSVVDLCGDASDASDEVEVLPRNSSLNNNNKRKRSAPRSDRAATRAERSKTNTGFSRHHANATAGGPVSMEDPAPDRRHDDESRQLSWAMAESNRNVVKQQNDEYHESLRRDKEKDLLKKEEELVERAMRESARLMENEERKAKESLTRQLDPEPIDGATDGVATVAFKLPPRCPTGRIVRRFQQNASADQLLFFLTGRSEMDNISKWTLCEVVGGREISIGSGKTLKDLDLAPRGLVIVRDEDS